jgi:hypothetical protein
LAELHPSPPKLALKLYRAFEIGPGGAVEHLLIGWSGTIEKPLQKIVSGYRPWRGAEQPGDWKTY